MQFSISWFCSKSFRGFFVFWWKVEGGVPENFWFATISNKNLQSVVQTKGSKFSTESKNPMNFRGLRRSGGLDSSSRKHATGAMDATLQTPTNATNAACAERERERRPD
jgi:hypothetical protein